MKEQSKLNSSGKYEDIVDSLWPFGSRRDSNFINKYGVYPLDIMLIGSKGCGKSTLINSMIESHPSYLPSHLLHNTTEITNYTPYKGIRFWDTPGYGVHETQDKFILNSLVNGIGKKNFSNLEGYCSSIIDLALIITDCRTNPVSNISKIIKDISLAGYDRKIIIGINFIDLYAHGRGWREDANQPSKMLQYHIESLEKYISHKLFIDSHILIDDIISFSGLKSYNTSSIPTLILSHFENSNL